MLKIAIVGYGNLGKSLEKETQKNTETELVAVYSRREINHPRYRPMKEIGKKQDFDVAMLALGSYSDIESYANAFENIDTVDSFDTHAKIAEYKAYLNSVKKESLAIISTGWDPGLLSLARAVFGIGATEYATLWGEGVSQGHSNAIRAIPGVLDAVQFTVPKADALTRVSKGVTDGKLLHDRICYVACVENDKKEIEKQILSMPNYFEGYTTVVHFVSQQEVRELKRRTHHRGQVICTGEGFEANCTVTLDNNPDYTAKIMLAYAHALPQLKADGYRGAVDVFDIPMKYLASATML